MTWIVNTQHSPSTRYVKIFVIELSSRCIVLSAIIISADALQVSKPARKPSVEYYE